MFLSSTAWRYDSQKRITFRLSLVSSTSVFGMYDFEQPARRRSEAAATVRRDERIIDFATVEGECGFPSILARRPRSSNRGESDPGAGDRPQERGGGLD